MITREEAYTLVLKEINNPAMIRHSLAVEAVMRELAVHLDEDANLWGVTGLLHDLDTEQTIHNYPRHGYITCEMIGDSLPPEALQAIQVHPGHIPPQTPFDLGLFCADPVTGLITAAVLVNPSHQLCDIKVSSLQKKFKDKSFAAGASREGIASCSQIGIELPAFLELSLIAMRRIAPELGF